MNVKLLLPLLLFHFAAVASPGGEMASTIAACEKLKRQSDRDKCLEFAITAASTQRQAPPVVEAESASTLAKRRAADVLSAAADVQSVVASGVSYNDYGPYVQKLAIAMDRYKAASFLPEEKTAVEKLEQALTALQDARDYWQRDIEFFSRFSATTYPGGLPTDLAGTESIVSRYSIPTRKADFWGLSRGALRHEALAAIWQFAALRVSEAKDAINSIGATAVAGT